MKRFKELNITNIFLNVTTWSVCIYNKKLSIIVSLLENQNDHEQWTGSGNSCLFLCSVQQRNNLIFFIVFIILQKYSK